jgi:Spy/CpxP family protein refolding chaperone
MKTLITRGMTMFALLALPVTAAQPRLKSGQQPGAEQPGARARGGFARILTEEQREQVRQIMMEHRAQQRDLDERIQRLQREIEQVVFGERLNEDALRGKARELADAEAERTLFRARVIARIRSTLTEEQIERLKQVWAAAPRLRGRAQMADGPGRRFGTEREGTDLPPPRPAPPPNP